METASRPYEVVSVSPVRDVAVETFFHTLTQEQTRFLDAVGHARSLLGVESGQLAHVAALQLRMTREFLDAQRSIMRHRAEVDCQLAELVSADPNNELSPSSAADARRFAEPDISAAERQLASLLDDRWLAETRHSAVLIDATRAHLECGPGAPSPAPLLPFEMIAALDMADSGDPDGLFARLEDSLKFDAPVDASRAAPPLTEVVTWRNEAPARDHVVDLVPADSFRQFWDHELAPTGTPRSWTWFPTQVLLPMTVVMAVITAVMTWIG